MQKNTKDKHAKAHKVEKTIVNKNTYIKTLEDLGI